MVEGDAHDLALAGRETIPFIRDVQRLENDFLFA